MTGVLDVSKNVSKKKRSGFSFIHQILRATKRAIQLWESDERRRRRPDQPSSVVPSTEDDDDLCREYFTDGHNDDNDSD